MTSPQLLRPATPRSRVALNQVYRAKRAQDCDAAPRRHGMPGLFSLLPLVGKRRHDALARKQRARLLCCPDRERVAENRVVTDLLRAGVDLVPRHVRARDDAVLADSVLATVCYHRLE